jgi:ketosteroid isomerase-like protein
VTEEQVVRRFFAALAAFDADGAAGLVTDDYEGMSVDELPLHGDLAVYSGPDGIRTWVSEMAASWSAFEIEIARVRRHGELHVAIGVHGARGRSPFGALEHRQPFVAVVRVRDGKIAMIHAYARYEDAVRAEDLRRPASAPGDLDKQA